MYVLSVASLYKQHDARSLGVRGEVLKFFGSQKAFIAEKS